MGGILVVVAIFTLAAIALDAGFWYTEHRRAQNQAEAAALAAVSFLPAADTTAATAAVDAWLVKNGATAAQRSCLTYSDLNGDGKYDQVRVCVRRSVPGMLSTLSGIRSARVSAAATARVGPVDSTNVMPWAVVAPDPGCTEAAHRNCRYDANGDGDLTDPGDCNAAWTVCPFGLTPNRLYAFKFGTGGNTNIIQVCGGGAVQYRACLSGASSSGFYSVGDTVAVNTQPGTIANATDTGLQARPPAGAWDLPGAAVCNVAATPERTGSQSPGYDPDGKVLAKALFVGPPSPTNGDCAYRLVPVPITTVPGNGQTSVTILGFAVFGVAAWDTVNGNGQQYVGSASQACHVVNNNAVNNNVYPCGTVWGYLFTGVTPPDALLQQIGSSNNPFAPLLAALVD